MLVTRRERLSALAPAGERLRVIAVAVEATVEGEPDPATGMVVNLADMKRDLRRRLTAALDGVPLDGAGGRPRVRSAEELAGAAWRALGGRVADLALARLRVLGEDGGTVDFRGEGEEMDATRTYEFSASHRLHAAALGPAENERVFGKCNNPAGHGHNYVLEVTLRGRPGAGGELLAAAEFDAIVAAEVVDRWDHRHLNEDVAEFRGVNPTAEEIARVAWERLAAPLAAAGGGARLHRIKLLETARNHVEYFGPAGDAAPEGGA